MNPMLGHRGCRLGLTYPDVSEMQIEAFLKLPAMCRKMELNVVPEIMVPLVATAEEFTNGKRTGGSDC